MQSMASRIHKKKWNIYNCHSNLFRCGLLGIFKHQLGSKTNEGDHQWNQFQWKYVVCELSGICQFCSHCTNSSNVGYSYDMPRSWWSNFWYSWNTSRKSSRYWNVLLWIVLWYYCNWSLYLDLLQEKTI